MTKREAAMDAMFVLAAALVVWGVWQVSAAASTVVAGVLVALLGVIFFTEVDR